MSSSTATGGWRAAWSRFSDPGWVSDLTLDGPTRSRVRIAAAKLAQNDGVDGFASPFQKSRTDRARRLRRRLAKRWEQTPLAKLFTHEDEWSMLKQRAQAALAPQTECHHISQWYGQAWTR